MPVPYPIVLGFPDRPSPDVTMPIIGEDGELLATLLPATRRYRFTVEDPEGSVLCTGRLRSFMGWDAFDQDGAPLVRVGAGFFGRYAVRLPARGLKVVLRGRAYRGTLQVIDDKDFLINSVPPYSSWSFGNTDWLIRSNGVLSLAEVIAIVELHRLEMRRRRKPSRRQRLRRRRELMRGAGTPM